MQKLIAAIAVTSLLATGALADASAPLPAGQPAGVAKAQNTLDNTTWIVVGGIVVLVAVVLATNSSSSTVPAPAVITPATATTT
jgi:hypothetical protein